MAVHPEVTLKKRHVRKWGGTGFRMSYFCASHKQENLPQFCLDWSVESCPGLEAAACEHIVSLFMSELTETGTTGEQANEASFQCYLFLVQSNPCEPAGETPSRINSRYRSEKVKWGMRQQERSERQRTGVWEKWGAVGKRDGESPKQPDCEKERIRIPNLFSSPPSSSSSFTARPPACPDEIAARHIAADARESAQR